MPLLHDLSQVMSDASICGLGQAASNPLKCVLKYFPEEVNDDCKPEDLLEREVSISINDKNYTGRIDETILDVAKETTSIFPTLFPRWNETRWKLSSVCGKN